MISSSGTIQSPRSEPVSVMLVDDSSVIRSALTDIIESDVRLKVVSSMTNGEAAIDSARNKKPDIILLDIEMPVMDGITALPHILEASPKSKIIMFSSLTEKGASITLKAFSLGAVECVVKPSSTQMLHQKEDFRDRLISLILGLCGLSPAASPPPSIADLAKAKPTSLLSGTFILHDDRMSYRGKPRLIAIGSSTGGPNALFNVLKHFKGFDVPIILTQHMPATFTRILANHIAQHTGVDAVEGQNGMVLENGRVHVAPGDYHMTFTNEPQGVTIKLNQNPPVNFCRPAVDPMFESALPIFGNKILAVMLTGMGHDGLESSRKLVDAGARLIAQDEATSTVWGMPGAVAKAGLCSAVLPLDEIGPWVSRAMKGMA